MSYEMIKIYNRARIGDRQINELIGLSHGIIADNIVTEDEAEYLQKWLVANSVISDNPVIHNLMDRAHIMLSDKLLDKVESSELLETLKAFTGGNFELGELLKPTSLPLTNPAPKVTFSDRDFCFTGTFLHGTRKECEETIFQRQGHAGTLTKKTDYLVIGSYATNSWIHSSYGRKIEKAMGMQNKGAQISIISESHWMKHL